MSNAKREYSEFHHSAAAGRAASRSKLAGPDIWPAPDATDLRVLDHWEVTAAPGGDPYNGIGARAAVGRVQRK